MKQLPQYKCHKIVRAAKIVGVANTADFGAFIHFEDDVDSIQVNSDYIEKHKPQVGDYFVVYDDGYESVSPSKAFEDGYIIVPESGKGKPNDKETFIRFAEMALRKLNQEDFEKVYGTILPIADTIPGFDDLPDFNH